MTIRLIKYMFQQTCGEYILDLPNLEREKKGEEDEWDLENIDINSSPS